MLYFVPKSMASLAAAFAPVKPTLTGFARIETSPISPQLDAGLSAPLADPLWLIGRQWQFDELRGEDAGTPDKRTARSPSVSVTSRKRASVNVISLLLRRDGSV